MKSNSTVNLGVTRDPKLPVVETRGLSAGYGAQAVISDINLVLHPGEVVGLFGANGAGKTTTMLALAGELMPLEGEVVRLKILSKVDLPAPFLPMMPTVSPC